MTWHTVTRIAEHVFQISEPFGAIMPQFGVTTVNMYLVLGRERAALIDSGLGIGDVRAAIRKITSLPCMVLNTHYHWDHISANALFDEIAIHASQAHALTQAPDTRVFRQALRAPAARALLPPGFDPDAFRITVKPATRTLQDNDSIDLGDIVLKVLHTPGHSPDHVAYWHQASGVLFTGDSAYRGPLYVCFRDSDPAAFVSSTKRLAALPGVTAVCPGHNDIITERDWLSRLAECAEAALGGKVEGQLRDAFTVGREFRFDDLAIWLPQ